MASFSLDDNQALYQIRAFKVGQVQINDTIYTQNLIISPHQLIENWAPQTIADLNHASLAPAVTLKPDILIIGTGAKQEFIPLDSYGEFLNQGIGIELMDTAAACRTYNVLTAENRKVVAALLLQ
jgi:uncharacterized protein